VLVAPSAAWDHLAAWDPGSGASFALFGPSAVAVWFCLLPPHEAWQRSISSAPAFAKTQAGAAALRIGMLLWVPWAGWLTSLFRPGRSPKKTSKSSKRLGLLRRPHALRNCANSFCGTSEEGREVTSRISELRGLAAATCGGQQST